MAAFGLAQFLAGNGKFFWFYEHPFSNTYGCAKGSFSNRNHFAHFLALGIGPLVWWLQDAAADRADVAPTAVPPYAGLSLAFGGLVLLSAGLLVAFAGRDRRPCCWPRRFRRPSAAAAASLGPPAHRRAWRRAGLLIGVSLAIFGFDRVSNRLEDLSSGSLEQLDRGGGRRAIWAAALKAVPNALWCGTGVGSFREVYPMYTDLAGRRDRVHPRRKQLPAERRGDGRRGAGA